MATIKSFTDISQSKKLAEILSLESADMWWAYYYDVISDTGEYDKEPMLHKPICDPDKALPCWSLAALLGVIPKPDLVQNSEGTWLVRSWVNAYPWSVRGYSNPVDACYEMILKLHEINLL